MTSRRTVPDDEHVHRDGVKIRKTVTAHSGVTRSHLGLPGEGVYRIVVVADLDIDAWRFVNRRIEVTGEGCEVTGEVLRAIPVDTIVRDALRAYSGVPHEDPADLLDLGRAGPTTETLEAVGRVYRMGMLLGDAPTQRVADSFGVPRSTAGRWVTRSRDRGFLTVTDPRAPRSPVKPAGERDSDG